MCRKRANHTWVISAKTLGSKIDVGKGIMTVNSPPGTSHSFPKKRNKGKRGRQKAPTRYDLDAYSLENT